VQRGFYLGPLLWELAEAKGYTAKSLAAKTGISEQRLYQLGSGDKPRGLGPKNGPVIAAALGTTYEELRRLAATRRHEQVAERGDVLDAHERRIAELEAALRRLGGLQDE
jgi:transcriptional regulator with XRE-family HTH domain